MIQHAKQLAGSRFVRNVAIVATGTASSQLVTMAFIPVITRLYAPEAFGILGTFMAIAGFAAPLAALAYPIAIVLPQEDSEALGLVQLSIILSLAIASIVTALLWLGGDWFRTLDSVRPVSSYLLLIPLSVLFAGWVHIAQQWLIRKGEFAAIARAALAQSVALNAAKTALGWWNPAGALLIMATVAGNALLALLMATRARGRFLNGQTTFAWGTAASLGRLARQYRDFPRYRAPQNLLSNASDSLPILMLAALFGAPAAGFYALAKMVMGVPSTLIGQAVYDVFYPRITEAAQRQENVASVLMKATGALFAIGIVPFGFVMLLAPWLFSTILGDQWQPAGVYAQWLAVFYFFNFINKPSVAAVPVLGLQRSLLVYEFISIVAKAASLLIGFYGLASDFYAIALFSLTGATLYCTLMWWIISQARRRA